MLCGKGWQEVVGGEDLEKCFRVKGAVGAFSSKPVKTSFKYRGSRGRQGLRSLSGGETKPARVGVRDGHHVVKNEI